MSLVARLSASAAASARATVIFGSSVVSTASLARVTVGSGSPAMSAASPVRATVVFGSPAVLVALPLSAKVVSGLPVTTAAPGSAMGGGSFLGFPKWRGPIGGRGKRPRLR